MSTQLIKIKKAGLEDAQRVAIMVVKLLEEFNRSNNSNFNIDLTKVKIVTETLLIRNHYAAFIAFNENSAIGLITLSPAFAIYNGGDFGVITEFYVEDEWRSRGVGKMLLNNALEFARMSRFKKVEVGAPAAKEWPRTIKFYLENGFVEKGPKLRIELK